MLHNRIGFCYVTFCLWKQLNSFEQLCINYANEKLQYHFNEVIFSEEMNMYAQEGIPLESIVFEDNGECVNLIEAKPVGILALLEEECSLGNATDLTFINKLEKTFGTGKSNANKYFIKNRTKPDHFSVVHFAGAVEYNVNNFLDKNRDTLSVTTKEVMLSSQLSLVRDLFTERAAEDTSSAMQANNNGRKRGSAATSNGSTSSKSTLGGQFRNQLVGLVSNLRLTEPHFIRCVKPNHEKVGGKFDAHLALRQLRYAGLFEAIRIRKSGFAYRGSYAVFANTYQIIVSGLTKKRIAKEVTDQDACWYILQQMTSEGRISRDDWQIGNISKVFLKSNHDRVLLERERSFRLMRFVLSIQRFVRKSLERVRAKREAMMEQKEVHIKQEQFVRHSRAVVIIQKYWRRKQILNLVRSMSKFIELRRVLLRKETHKVRALLTRIEADLPDDLKNQLGIPLHTQKPNVKPTLAVAAVSPLQSRKEKEKEKQKKQLDTKYNQQHTIFAMFAHEIRVARVMLKVIDVQDSLVEGLRHAVEENNVKELNRLVLKAERLEMNAHPLVVEARDKIQWLFRKQQVMRTLLNFLKNEDEFHDSIGDYINEGYSLDIDKEFLSKVKTIFENAGPRWKTRSKLRTVIEQCNRYAIEQLCLEVLQIRKQHSRFAETELRAARMLLKLLNFDAQLYPSSFVADDKSQLDDDFESIAQDKDVSEGAMLWGRRILTTPTGSKLTPQIIDICQQISDTTSVVVAKKLKQRLQVLIGGSPEHLFAVIRYFKWSKAVCVWNFPEITALQCELQPPPLLTKAESDDHPAGDPSGTAQSNKGLSAIFGSNTFETPSKQNSRMTMSMLVEDEDEDRHLVDTRDVASVNSTFDEDIGKEEFFGIRFREARANTYLIRSLHQDFDLFQQTSQLGELEAAIGNISVSESVQATLKDLDQINDINLKMPLPNGSTFEKTAIVYPSSSSKLNKSQSLQSTQSRAATTTMNASHTHKKVGSFASTFLFILKT
jgi:hypothetical protein